MRVTTATRLRAVVPLLAVAAAILVADQLSKAWIVATLGRGQVSHQIDLIPGWLALQYVENTGAAFGLFHDGGWILALVAIAAVVGIVVTAPRLHEEAGSILARRQILLSLGLVLGGAVGNLLDRILRGFVVDFILVPVAHLVVGTTNYRFPNFNAADSAITVGIVLLMLNLFLTGGDKRT